MVTVSFENEEFGTLVRTGVTPGGIAIFTVLFAKLPHEILQISIETFPLSIGAMN
jgi:hypothetical protein